MLIHDLKKLTIDNGELTIIVEISFNQTNFFNRLLKGISSKLLLREVSIIVYCQSSIRIV